MPCHELPPPRGIERVLTSRIARDTNFRHGGTGAFDSTCAFTVVRIINGGGRAEVRAAHIWPANEGGPDTIRNGLALSSMVHWMFDRRLRILSDNFEMLISHNKGAGGMALDVGAPPAAHPAAARPALSPASRRF